jgi:DNA-binding SARP family transcriptional activator
VLTACCQRGFADVPAPILQNWVDALPDPQRVTPSGLLLRGLLARNQQPFGSGTSTLLRSAAAGFRHEGDIAGEVAATSELAYVLRNQGRLPELIELLVRGDELHATGHPAARGPAALAQALLAEVAGDPDEVLRALGRVTPDMLGREWRAVASFLETTTHLTLGDTAATVAAATRCAHESGGATTRHALAMAEWYAGEPCRALSTIDEIVADAQRSSIDGVALGALATLVEASRGRLDEATHALAIAERAAASAAGPGPLMRGVLAGARAFLAAASGDDDAARSELVDALEGTPVHEPHGWRTVSRWLVPTWVLVPSARSDIEARSLGDRHRAQLVAARALVAARETGQVPESLVGGLDPGTVATTMPLPWAMTLAATCAGPFGPRLVSALYAWHGEHSRDALRAVAGCSDVQTGARRLLATVALPPSEPVHIDVLGPTVLRHGSTTHDDADWRQRERVRSLVTYLALHGGATREQLVDAVWPDLDADAAARNLRVTLTYVHRALEPQRSKGEATFVLRAIGNRLELAGSPHVEIDAHRFAALLDEAERLDRLGVPSDAVRTYDRALDRWRGPSLADVRYDEWAQPFVQALTDRYARACVRSGQLHLADHRPALARARAGAALDADPWSEPAHLLLAMVAMLEDDHAGALVALDRCEAMLADLGARPTEPTRALRSRVATG